jgi:GTPase
MSYRMDEGHGRCIYRLGVEDNGCHSLLNYSQVAESARIIEYLARSLNAVVVERKMIQNEILFDASLGEPVRSNVEPIYAEEPSLLGDAMGIVQETKEDGQMLNKEDGIYTRGEIIIQRIETHLLDPSPVQLLTRNPVEEENATESTSDGKLQEEKEAPLQDQKFSVGETLSARNIRVAVVGNVDAGKSTLIGTLTTSSLDDGRGKSRTAIMKHRHEIESGRTSTATTHLMGFRSNGQAIASRDKVRANKHKGEDEIARESYRVITLMDLAGHEKYLKTT